MSLATVFLPFAAALTPEQEACSIADPAAELTDAQQACLTEFDQSLAGDPMWLVIVKAVLILVFLLVSVLFAVWFERRVIGRLQQRPGPNRQGPWGLLQPVADAMKLLFKEDITVRASEKVLYIAAPMISVFCALLIFAVIPFGPATGIPFTDIVTPLQLTDFPVAVLYILACAALGVYGIVLGGWASGSTYPLMGSVRSTAQVISYELAMGLSSPSSCCRVRCPPRTSSIRSTGCGGWCRSCRPSCSTSSPWWARRTACLSICLRPKASWSRAS